MRTPQTIKSLLTRAGEHLPSKPGATSNPIVIYCCSLGGYDDLPTFSHVDPEMSKVCFTDTPERFESSTDWTIVPIESAFTDAKLMNGYLKSSSHRLFGFDVTAVWVDANLKDLSLSRALIEELLQQGPVATPPHLRRYGLNEEISAVVGEGLETEISAQRVADLVERDGFPEDRPLSATMMVVRDNSSAPLRAANEQWQKLICSGIRRDQLTFDYALWTQGLKAARIDVDWRDPNRVFNRVPHKNVSTRPAPGDSAGSTHPGLNMPNLPTEYPADVRWVFETETEAEGRICRELNGVVAATAPGGKVEGNYCHMNEAVLRTETPSDPRRSWKREYLRGAVKGSSRALEIGFNAGHSAVLLLEAEPKLKLTSVDIAIHDYVRPCGDVMREAYGKRFDLIAEDSLIAMKTIDLTKYDFVHIDGGHGKDIFAPELDWFCTDASAGTRLLVDDCYVSHIRAALDNKVELGLIRPQETDLASSGENELFVRTQ